MGFDYSSLINNLQSQQKGFLKEGIKPDDIDLLFSTLTDIYISILEKGLLSVETNSMQSLSVHTKNYLLAGLNFHKQSMIPQTIELILDFMLIQTSRDPTVTQQELFEIYLLAKILPIIRPENECIKNYINFIIEFCSGKVQHFQISKFIKFIDIYELTDCHVLNLIKG